MFSTADSAGLKHPISVRIAAKHRNVKKPVSIPRGEVEMNAR